MEESLFDHAERKLEKEMLDAAQHVADVAHVEKDPLLIILWRLNHQDRTLDGIKTNLSNVTVTLSEHIAQNESIKESIDELVAFWTGSKLAGKVISWGVGICAAAAAAFASIKRGMFS
jgi:hypothetical protein